MRRTFVLLCAVVMMAGLAVPAGAAKPTKSTWQSGSAYAEWSEVIQTGGGSSTIRYTSVWADSYDGGGGVWVDQYEYRCRLSGGRERCTGGNYRYGWGEGTVTIAGDLSSASVEATVTLEGRRGQTSALPLSVQWTATGSTTKTRYSFSERNECFSFRYTSSGQRRTATATGTLGGTSLGTSTWGEIGTQMSRDMIREGCDLVW